MVTPSQTQKLETPYKTLPFTLEVKRVNVIIQEVSWIINFFNVHSAANLQPDTQPFSIPVSGRSLLPYCHFDLEESDYISGGRRNPELRGPGGAPPGSTLDPSTKVIEFKSCGVKVKNIK